MSALFRLIFRTFAHKIEHREDMTLRELLSSVSADEYTDYPLYQELLKVKPEYGSSRHIEVKMVNGEVEMTSQNFDEAEQSEFWNDMTNLQKAKIIR